MEQSADFPPPRRSVFFPVVIATVFLAIIGMSAGMALASWHGSRNNAESGQNGGKAVVDPTAEPGAGASPRDPSTGPACRPETQEIAQKHGAQGELRPRLTLHTKTSDVYICADEAGALYYHANVVGGGWIEGETSLFMTGVEPGGQESYVVVHDDGTRFEVDATRLVITRPNGEREVQLAAG